MGDVIAQGPLFGRPFGGVAALVRNDLRGHCETVIACDRFLILKLLDYFIVNIYLLCIGTVDRLSLCESILNDILFGVTNILNVLTC